MATLEAVPAARGPAAEPPAEIGVVPPDIGRAEEPMVGDLMQAGG
jgi:hypothetical protein